MNAIVDRRIDRIRESTNAPRMERGADERRSFGRNEVKYVRNGEICEVLAFEELKVGL
jgi:hypothetical protein